MSVTLRNSDQRRKKRTDEKVPGRPGDTSAQAMAPTQMKLRMRRRGAAATDAAAEASQPEEDDERTRHTGSRSSRRKNSSRASTADMSSSPPGSSSVSAQADMIVGEDASPDSKCPICLDRFNNLAYLDRCLHRFCFPCIQEWSHNKAECPLCKQPFASILHSVRAEDDFKEYTLQPAPTNSSVAATVAMVAAMASAARSNHQMRLMLRRHRGVDAGDRRRRERRGRRRSDSRIGERMAMGEWYLDSSVTLPRYPSASPVLTDNSEETDDLDERRMSDEADSPDGGVIFEGMMRLGGAVVPVTSGNRESRRMMIQLAARRRLQQESGTARQVRERETVAFRRDLYRCGIRVNGIATISFQGQQQQQHDITAESFRHNPELLNRLRPWLRRELTVLYGAHGSLVDIIQRIIMARLARHGLEDTPMIEEELRPFLLARTDHFLHELVSFARSPLSLESYDLQAVYEPPTTPMELEAISSSSDSVSVIAISEGEEQGQLGGEQNGAGCGASDVIQTRSSLRQSTWDDETPGPSYSAAEPSCSLSSLSFSPTRPEAAHEEEGEEECLIVGYKKPIAERTPELVQLSSDSEDEEPEQEKKEEDKLSVSPTTTTPLPIIPPSTSGTCRNEQEDDLKEKDEEVCQQTFCSERRRNSLGHPERWESRVECNSEERRRQRKVKEQRRRKSGTLFNPNRCIYPAMMHYRSRSSSPFQSSAESSPPDSSWEYSCPQVSPLTSSVSSPSHVSWSSSPPRSPTHSTVQSSPTPLAIPCERGEKPGGKRKYKSRHLDSNSEDPLWKPKNRSSHRRERRRERKKKERRRKHRQEGRRDRSTEGGSRRSREDRSPSVEIIYEGPVGSHGTHKRHRKHNHRTPHSSSPVIITIHSDGSLDGVDGGSPGGSQHNLDLSHVLSLPLLLPDGIHQTTNAEDGELPVDILNQEFRDLDREPPGQTQGSSDHDVDVETVEGNDFLPGSEEDKRSKVITVDSSSHLAGLSNAKISDSRLLASILGDLQVITQPKCSFSSSFDGRPSTERPVRDHGSEVNQPTPDLPPLLKQVSPVRSYSRNTPPPLKRSDAPSPRPLCSDAQTAGCATSCNPSSPPGSSSRGASISAGCLQDCSFTPSSELQPGKGEMLSAASCPPSDLQRDASVSAVDLPSACSDASAHSQPTSTQCRDVGVLPDVCGSADVNHSFMLSDDSLECGPDDHFSPIEVNTPARPPPPASSVLIVATNFTSFSSDISCRSSQIPSSAASEGPMDRDELSLGDEDPPPSHLQSTCLKYSVGSTAPPFVHHTALSSTASSDGSKVTTETCSDLLIDSQESSFESH